MTGTLTRHESETKRDPASVRIFVQHHKGIGNLTFRYMFAERLAAEFPAAEVIGHNMPEFGLVSDVTAAEFHNPYTIGKGGHVFDVSGIASRFREGACDGYIVDCYAQRLEYFESRLERYRAIFKDDESQGVHLRPDQIAIHVRGGDILKGKHADYMPVPISFYDELLGKYPDLQPVFIGQLDDNPYADVLRQRFPNAEFIPGKGRMDDFMTLRRATNIVLSVSTFAWLAAWLSKAERIHMPLIGLFNPAQRPDVDLAPQTDTRFVFHRFPKFHFTGSVDDWKIIFWGRRTGAVEARAAGDVTTDNE